VIITTTLIYCDLIDFPGTFLFNQKIKNLKNFLCKKKRKVMREGRREQKGRRKGCFPLSSVLK